MGRNRNIDPVRLTQPLVGEKLAINDVIKENGYVFVQLENNKRNTTGDKKNVMLKVKDLVGSGNGSGPVPGDQFDVLVSDGAGGFLSSNLVTAFPSSGRIQLTDNDDRSTNYNGNGLAVFNIAGNTSLIEFNAQSDNEVILSIGDFADPDVWITNNPSSFFQNGCWIDIGQEFGIGTRTPDPNVTLDIGGTSAVKVPVGTFAQRANTLGAVRYNSELGRLEVRGGFLNQSSSYQFLGENPKDMSIFGESSINANSTYSESFNLSPFKTVDGAVELVFRVIAYDAGNDLCFSGEYRALYKDIIGTASLIGAQQTVYEITDDVGNPLLVTLDANAGSARIRLATTTFAAPARTYDFYWEGTFRYHRNKVSA